MTDVGTRLKTVLIVFLILATTSACRMVNSRRPQQMSGTPLVENGQIPRLEIPDAQWEAPFYAALEERIKQVSLPSLRTVLLPENDLEVRFWYDARPDIINGIVLRRSGARWSAIGVRQTTEQRYSPVKQEMLKSPKSGWDAAWKRFVDAGILTLPDGSKVNCPTEIFGGAYVVETNVNGTYRTYRYNSPQFARCNEAKRIVLIEEILADEFGLQLAQK
jgi:hypothetical protein